MNDAENFKRAAAMVAVAQRMSPAAEKLRAVLAEIAARRGFPMPKDSKQCEK